MLQDEFLAGCNQLWGKRELRAVHKKLEKIGVEGVPDLLRENLSKCWNTVSFNAVFSPNDSTKSWYLHLPCVCWWLTLLIHHF